MPDTAPNDAARDATITAVAVTMAMLVYHLYAASRLEFMFDEAYYALWARHLSWGYYDHPPMVAAWIRFSTTLFGQSEFGARVLGIVASAFGSLGIYVIARDLLGNTHKALLATLLWNTTPLIGVGAILVTPDTPLVTFWTTALWGLGRLYRTGDRRWWLLIGLAAGLALQSKYTALFLGASLVLAMIIVPPLRRWWRHPAPYVGGALALALFGPNFLWNAQHGWQTFGKQFGRVADAELTLKFAAEFLGAQIGLLGPLTFVLVIAGLILAWRGADDGENNGRRILLAMAAPLLVYFVIHSLHDRVQGNWLAPLYPVLAILAADAALTTILRPAWAANLLEFSRRWAALLGGCLVAIVFLQAQFAPFAIPPRSDPTALLKGWRQLASDINTLVRQEGAGYVLTQGYALNSLLQVYSPNGPPVFQFNEPQRWSYNPARSQPDASAPGLLIVELRRLNQPEPRARFASIREIARLTRTRRGAVLDTYMVFRVANPTRPILDSEPPAPPKGP